MGVRIFTKQHIFLDPSFWGVIAGNALSIFAAMKYGLNLNETLWIYWAQSVVIGLVNFYRIWTLEKFSAAGITIDGKPLIEDEISKQQMALLFILVWAFLHVVYAVSLSERLALGDIEAGQLFWIIICATGFMGAHGFSFLYNVKRDFKAKKPNLGAIMWYPYLRVLPMHLMVVGGIAAGAEIVVFMALKTFADVGMHVVEHRMFQSPKRTDLRIPFRRKF